VSIVSESGLYKLIMRSDKEEAQGPTLVAPEAAGDSPQGHGMPSRVPAYQEPRKTP